MDRPLYFRDDLGPYVHQHQPSWGREVKTEFPTLQDYFRDHVARNDPDPREDLIHPFVD